MISCDSDIKIATGLGPGKFEHSSTCGKYGQRQGNQRFLKCWELKCRNGVVDM
jgi:hypothetical protein